MAPADEYLQPEQRARMQIDEQLVACGWVVQDYRSAAVGAARGVAVREVPTAVGPADYVLFVDKQAVGVIEAKKVGTTLTGVEWQTYTYQTNLTDEMPAVLVDGALPFAYQSTGVATRFTNGFDPVPASRGVFAFHRPETFARWVDDYVELDLSPTFRAGVQRLPELDPAGLWPAQVDAVRNLEASLQDNRPKALIQMATGSGKTYTAATITYRLLRHARASRVLFLVDRGNLGKQAIREFEGFDAPGDGRKFTELYGARRLTDSNLDIADEAATKVHVATIQRVYSILRGEELAEDLDEQSGADSAPERDVEVAYNPKLPIESYDMVIVDECHRSIYGVWRQVLDYFDAFIVGLTATPGKHTFGYFDQNLVMEYGHQQAVADRVNVDFDVFRIRTEITEQGGKIEEGFLTKFADRETRAVRYERADEDIEYTANELDRKVVATDQIRTVIRTLRDSMPDMFPDRKVVDGRLEHIPKTLIFAKSDAHADDIVQVVREEFGLGNLGAVKITYTASQSGHKPDELLAQFRTGYETRVAVTVDMIATGTDVRPLECVVFMRMVKSRNFFEQMKGRGVRIINDDDLRMVTPDARSKDRFVLVDAVGVSETKLHDTLPLERKHQVGFDRLLNQIGLGVTDHDVVSSVASRLARLDKRITKADRAEVEQVAGMSLREMARNLVDAIDLDNQYAAAQQHTGSVDPTADQVAAAGKAVIEAALEPLVSSSDLRVKLVEVRKSYEQVYDEYSKDHVISGEFSKEATDRARTIADSFKAFIETNKDEITALQILYSQPYGGGLSFADIRELANAIERPPQRWTPEELWNAYESLDASKVRGSGNRVNTDLVSLVRFALGEADELVAYPELVNERFAAWLTQQANAGRDFSADQVTYLELIRNHLAASLDIKPRDLTAAPFSEHGGLGRARQLFGDTLNPLLHELTQALAA